MSVKKMTDECHSKQHQAFAVRKPTFVRHTDNRFINFMSIPSEGMQSNQDWIQHHDRKKGHVSSKIVVPDMLESARKDINFMRELKIAEQRARIHANFHVELNRITKELERERDMQLQALECHPDSSSLLLSALHSTYIPESTNQYIQSQSVAKYPTQVPIWGPTVSTFFSREGCTDQDEPELMRTSQVLKKPSFNPGSQVKLPSLPEFVTAAVNVNMQASNTSKLCQIASRQDTEGAKVKDDRSAIIASALARLKSLEFKFCSRMKPKKVSGKKCMRK